MACSQEEVKKLVDYTMSFDRRFIADEVVKLCQKEKLIDYSPEEICYYTWFLQMFGPQCIDKESVHQISDKPDMVNTMYLKKFTYSIPKSVGDKNKFMKILEVCQQYLQNSISVAKKDGIKEEVNGKFVLTSDAPPEAKRSFAEWNKPRKITLRHLLRTIRAKLFENMKFEK